MPRLIINLVETGHIIETETPIIIETETPMLIETETPMIINSDTIFDFWFVYITPDTFIGIKYTILN